MDCKSFESEMVDLVLTPGASPSVAAAAHLQVCPPCAQEYLSMQATFSLLDTWTVPEPTPYFDQKLAVLLREERAAPRMGWFESLTTRLRLNTGRSFRPAMVGALSLALLAGGSSLLMIPGSHPVQASAAVTDLQILDRNEQAFQQMDELQQDDDGGAQNHSDVAPAAPPTT